MALLIKDAPREESDVVGAYKDGQKKVIAKVAEAK